jgi:hypothetical protein
MVVLAIGCTAVLAGMTAAPAVAWEETVSGVRFGWNEEYGRQAEYAFAEASDATLANLGAGEITRLACKALTDDIPVAFLCKELVKPFVNGWIDSEFADDNHGHWVEFYPHEHNHVRHGHW